MGKEKGLVTKIIATNTDNIAVVSATLEPPASRISLPTGVWIGSVLAFTVIYAVCFLLRRARHGWQGGGPPAGAGGRDAHSVPGAGGRRRLWYFWRGPGPGLFGGHGGGQRTREASRAGERLPALSGTGSYSAWR